MENIKEKLKDDSGCEKLDQILKIAQNKGNIGVPGRWAEKAEALKSRETHKKPHKEKS